MIVTRMFDMRKCAESEQTFYDLICNLIDLFI